MATTTTMIVLATSLLLSALLFPVGCLGRSREFPDDDVVLSSICKSRCSVHRASLQDSSCPFACHSPGQGPTSTPAGHPGPSDCPLPGTCQLECSFHFRESPSRNDDDEDDDDENGHPLTEGVSTIIGANGTDKGSECLLSCCYRLQNNIDLLPPPAISSNQSFVALDWSDVFDMDDDDDDDGDNDRNNSNDNNDDDDNNTIFFHVERKFVDATIWEEIFQTSETTLTLPYPGKPHLYRIWATNSTAFLGMSKESLPLEQNGGTDEKEEEEEEEEEEVEGEDMAPPGPPDNLTEGDTLLSDGRISVFITWSPPRQTLTPVTKYNIIWTKRSSSYYEPKSSNRRSVPATQHTFQLHNLEQGASYLVQVQAVSRNGKKRLKSSKSGIVITTYPVPFAPFAEEHLSMPSTPTPIHHRRHHHNHHHYSNGKQNPASLALITNLTLGRPYYEDANLKVALYWNASKSSNVTSHSYLVTWYPDACIVDDSSKMRKNRSYLPSTLTLLAENKSATLHSLSVNCRYTARVEVEDRRRRRPHHHQAKASDSKPEAKNPSDDDDEDDDESPFAEDDYIYESIERSQSSSSSSTSSSSSSSSSPSNHISFATPSCGKPKNTHNNADDHFCINTDVLLPDRVRNLEYRFLISGSSNVTCRITWKVPVSQSQIVGYKLTWIPSPSLFPLDESLFSKDGSAGDRDDDEHPLYKTLFGDDDLNDDYDDDADGDDENDDDEGAIESKSPARKRSVFLDHSTLGLNIGDLHEATTYVLRIHAVSLEGPGKGSYIHFTTPSLQTAPGRWKSSSGRKEQRLQFQDVSTHRVKSFMRAASSSSSSSSFSLLSSSSSSSSAVTLYLLIDVIAWYLVT